MPEARRSSHAVRHALAALGYQETINFSFVEEQLETALAGNAQPIRVLNPIAAPLAVMRSSLMGSLLGVLRSNLARKATRVRVFELGRVFMRDHTVADGPLSVAGIHQPLRVAGLAYGAANSLQWGEKERGVDFFDIKGDLQALLSTQTLTFTRAEHPALHPGRCAAVHRAGQLLGHVGELHPRWRQAWDLPHAPVLFELDLQAVLDTTVPLFAPVQRQQSVWRDLALVVDDSVSHDALVHALVFAVEQDPSALVRKATLFDIYKPALPVPGLAAGQRSLALRLELLDDEATLSEDRIEAAMAAAVQRAAQACGARLRA